MVFESVKEELSGISNTIFQIPILNICYNPIYGLFPLSIEANYIPTLSFETFTFKNYWISYLDAA